jgi:hypothetical protein
LNVTRLKLTHLCVQSVSIERDIHAPCVGRVRPVQGGHKLGTLIFHFHQGAIDIDAPIERLRDIAELALSNVDRGVGIDANLTLAHELRAALWRRLAHLTDLTKAHQSHVRTGRHRERYEGDQDG